ncbi:hypothetical protein H6P81_020403 [Aristolochia fimbriata]|uniref:Aldehyde oxygenase (deformylating) n=1 Tax=Aristolochia fimbriata TaxID=158543 RepID=A0AAV7DYQ8_ARIFI|nr:hypothetical protein H6P81_020403 [Aristolochia fimbriata]
MGGGTNHKARLSSIHMPQWRKKRKDEGRREKMEEEKLHRTLHHHYLYSLYHAHHHSSIATEPISSVVHPFAEILSYYILFSIPQLLMLFTGTASHLAFVAYLTYIDFMNNMGYCNFELVPNWVFKVFPPLKCFMYTPSFHSLHHTQFRTNYSLFMPLYDYMYGTVDRSSDALYEKSLKGEKEIPQNWLPRRVMSGWRVGGIVHALEGWDGHECGREVLEPDRVWKAALGHGFLPLIHIRYSMASPNLVEISPTVYVWHRKI